MPVPPLAVVVIGERTLGVFEPVVDFEVGESNGVVVDFVDRFDVNDLLDVMLCGLSSEVFGSDGVLV